MALFHTTVLDNQIKALPTVAEVNSGTNFVMGVIDSSNINTSGKIVSRTGSSMFYAPVKQGKSYDIVSDDEGGYIYGFFADVPVMGSTSYNGSRTVDENVNRFTAPINGYVAFRGVVTSNCGLYASGAIASFNTDLTENLVEVKCQIVAKQASGTPSPDNPLPITVYNQLNLAYVENTDKMSWLQGIVNCTYGLVDLGSLTFGANVNNCQNALLPNTPAQNVASTQPNAILSNGFTYSGSAYGVGSVDKTYCFNNGRLWLYDFSLIGKTPAEVKTALSGVYLIYELATPTTNPTYTASDFNTMLTSFGIDGSLYNIPFGQTVANGVLDITTGKLRVTHGVVDLGSPSTNYTKDSALTGIERFKFAISNITSVSSSSIPQNAICSYYPIVSITNANQNLLTDVLCVFVKDGYIYTEAGTYADANALRTALNGQYFVYKYETPQEIQLDSITLQALLNENNIWCDTGDTEVKYLLTVGKKIS